jgi:chromosome segregation ATPase
MRTSGLNSLAPGSSNGVQFRDFGLSSARRWMYDGDRSLLESSSDFETLQRRLAEMEQRLRDANEEIDRAREDAKAAAKMRRKLDEARTEASEANAREAAAVADRDAVWKALRGQLADAAKARAAIETESLAIATDLEQAKTALDAALTSQSSCGGAVDEDLRAALDDAEANKRTLQEKVDNLSNTVDRLNRQLSELSASKSAELDAAEERDRLREETRRVTETLASK